MNPAAPAESDFRLINQSGFGDGWNHYAHSMAWFRGKIYVGTTRGSFAAIKMNQPAPDFRPWPVDCPPDIYDIERRAQIWEYTPETDAWRLAYRAPAVRGNNGRENVPRYIGYRGMVVFKARTDAAPCLYVSTWAPQLAEPPEILRSEDGVHFEAVPAPPWGDAVRAFRSLQEFDGRVHTSPTASGRTLGKAQDSVGSDPTVYASDDVRSGAWRPANERGFGNPGNVTIFEMETFNGQLYAGTVNATTGCELWRAQPGAVPYRWSKVLDRGAMRGPINEAVSCMCEFKGALYVGTGVINGGYHRAHRVGPAAAELLRVWPDDSWDLIMGDSRVTEHGVKYPLSGHAPGFDSLFNGYIWRMCVHQGWLYAGTLCWAVLLPFVRRHAWPEDLLALVHRWGIETLQRRFGGFELWRTADGVHWEPVTRSGFGNRYNWGARNIVSTPRGLFVGTANPFGPTIAVQRGQQWSYVPNARGGCEVWMAP